MATSPLLDPDVLENAALIMFDRLTFAEGMVEMPCLPHLLEEQMQLIHGLLYALHQRPPQEELEQWRTQIAEKLVIGSQEPEFHRLVLRYEPYDPLVGLTGGFNLRISVQPADPIDYQQLDPETASPQELCRHMSLAWGELLFPCVPTLLPKIIELLREVLAALGQELSETELASYHRLLEPKLSQWFEQESNTRLQIRYSPLEKTLGLLGGVNIELSSKITTIESNYSRWTETRTGPLFGQHSDTKVRAVAQQLAQDRHPNSLRILDVGAGTGRNSFPLAQQGFQVEALELTQVLAQKITERSQAENLPLQIWIGDLLDRQLDLPQNSYDFIFLSEVIATHFRNPEHVRQALIRLCELVKEGGVILFDVFLCWEGYEPPPMVRQLARVYWTYVMTETELHQALQDLPLEQVSNESACEFEREHTPEGLWPPTGWFENWATGRNIFPTSTRPPLELRWLLYRRLPGDLPSA